MNHLTTYEATQSRGYWTVSEAVFCGYSSWECLDGRNELWERNNSAVDTLAITIATTHTRGEESQPQHQPQTYYE